MGLNYPLDIDAWAAWQKKQNALRWAKTEAAGFFRRNRGNTQLCAARIDCARLVLTHQLQRPAGAPQIPEHYRAGHLVPEY